ncbi:MAG: oligosaccharide flippase family protein [Lentimicrobiaceae bacterium]|jgi:O-antigen/teichoic acid export membrane protein|nr:oligosaccharide flippase family protein [Candidatus Scalindua sp.]MBT6671632.1 oligosaccharide flippase family protein [Lentimicrobiaceae bacterium]
MKTNQVQNNISYGKIFSAFKILTGATLLSVILGIATNKIIAVVAGTNGIALIGLYRNLISMVVTVLSMGMSTVIVQRISTTTDTDTLDELIRAVLFLLFFQIAVVVLLLSFFSETISRCMFGPHAGPSHTLSIKIVLFMALGTMIMQAMIAILNGKVNLKPITIINIVSSISTFVLVYPLIKTGNIGLAIVVGSGSMIGACVGVFMVQRIYGLKFRNMLSSIRSGNFLLKLPVSGYLSLHPIVTTITFLGIQVIVNNNYGVNGLGFYNAVITIETTSVMLVMSSVRSFYLPALGKLDNQVDKEEFINKMITMLAIFMLPITVCLILGSKYILWILYSEKFVPAANLLALQSMAMILHAYGWCYVFYLNHKAQYGTYLILDSVWASLLIGGTWYFSSHGFPLTVVFVNYLIATLISFSLYLVVIRTRYGSGMLNMRNIKLGLAAFLIVALSFIISQKTGLLVHIIYFSSIVAYTCYLIKKYLFQESVLEIM